jgi:hypothetical protein
VLEKLLVFAEDFLAKLGVVSWDDVTPAVHLRLAEVPAPSIFPIL